MLISGTPAANLAAEIAGQQQSRLQSGQSNLTPPVSAEQNVDRAAEQALQFSEAQTFGANGQISGGDAPGSRLNLSA